MNHIFYMRQEYDQRLQLSHKLLLTKNRILVSQDERIVFDDFVELAQKLNARMLPSI